MRTLSRISAALVVSLAVAGCGGGDSPSGPNNNNGGGGGGGPVATNQVTVSNDQFSPNAILVSTGSTVTWTWAQGAASHNVTFSDQSSGDKSAGGTYSRSFATAGTYNYQCTIHPGMTGSVTVQ